MKKKFLFLIIIIIVIFFFVWILDDEDEYYSNISDDTYTLMIYMCGSDLESEAGAATDDIEEMLEAFIDKKLNVIVETGGSSEWQNYNISSDNNQIYKISENKIELVKNLDANYEMTNSKTLSNFISYVKENYPADKYGLILWDHGGGAISGYGYDELAVDSEDTLTIDELKSVIDNSGIDFEFIGFDACLMANIETAFSLKNHTKYLIASEEIEPGTGWEYKTLLSKLSSDTSMSGKELGKIIVDSYIKDNNSFFSFEDATLSVIDLSKIDDLFNKLIAFVKEIKKENLDLDDFASISKAVSKTKSFADGEIDMFDLVDFVNKVDNNKSDDLIKSINDAVIYHKNTDLIEDSNGISFYWPYQNLEYYDNMVEIYNNIGIDDEYTNVLTNFINYLVGGKRSKYSLNNHEYDIDDDYSLYDWYDNSFIYSHSDYYEDNAYNGELEIIESDGHYILEFDESDWDLINDITCEVMVDDGEEGYINLGSDDYFEVDDDGNLIVDFDGSWIALNGYIVPYYAVSNDENYMGKVQALLNDKLVNIVIKWDKNGGKVIGAELVDQYGNTTIYHKGLMEIKENDKIEFLFDYYTYDGEYEDSYTLYEPLYVPKKGLIVSYEDTFVDSFVYYYKITDIYNNIYYTEPVVISE